MSRGYGELQRQLLAILTEHGHTADRWSRARYAWRWREPLMAASPRAEQVVSVRRALAALMRNGEVRIFMSYGHRHYWIREQAGRERPG